ncbi:NAD(P)/FAD-dependent oxidoreductase [Gammaproteobacteria bacterium]|nr:NAD(P)/FAD-dependent oxidoreductase [Gammaproteobacteria bacterium]MDA9292571.1 NAD(P)/FAD-dependent oxidoreductase [Gammaproteobacteria bacterium]MDB4072592.1 NAD(P)/FAD-dependent oxidoreductase [Gammaproteobacteria bacterium]MDB4194573.1 NAD(P)/FAD-dependent oxidoreductase [Gammaproteobacteria bacterium]MDB9901096.1 NAD(P)/FAD-dependent oxidoreductase [Gammaproteobacteria bacterium]|tara:strand:- start:12 stop:1460 length:1449 start_codon:yes stop_codon:yes gene_type:complete
MHKDIIIVGAGISGIAAGYNLQKSCPDKSFAILEGREALGGTWDLFKYPGVRSDSDMHTLGFRFKPWIHKKAIADGPSILKYLNETVDDYNLREKITYNQKVIASNWVSDSSIWELTVDDNGQEISMSCNFLFLCGGYYSYDKPYMPDFPGMDEFNGRVIHPQFWDESLDYSNKKVVVIGSGATAVTLVPAIAESAKQTTMLQRSPSYVISAPAEDSWNNALNKIFPVKFTYFVIRWKNILRTIIGFYLSRKYPERIKERLINLVREELGQDFDVEKHFTPSYKPWDQRMCLVPDGDLFSAIKDNRANVVTDTIDTFTPTGILLNSGNEIEADIVISATGIELNALNDINVSVDGVKVEANRKLSYKGMMLSGVPNLAISFGYVNSSWTLRADLTCEYVCRLINTMDKEGCAACSPEEDLNALVEDDYIDFTSGYVQRALDRLPKQGKKSPWRNYQNYLLDIFYVRLFSIKDSTLRFYNPKN